MTLGSGSLVKYLYTIMSKRNRSSINIIPVLVLLFIIACLASAVMLMLYIPQRAAEYFGEANPALGYSAKFKYSATLLLGKKNLLTPGDINGKPTIFQIEMGESVNSISIRLEDAGLISDGDVFRNYLIYSGIDYTLQAGEYLLSPALTPLEIARAMQDATPSEVPFTILPGWRIEEISASLPSSGLNISPDEFVNSARYLENIQLIDEFSALGSLEGFLYPQTYRFSRTASTQDLLMTFLGAFREQITPEMIDGWNRQGLDVQQAVVLASIIQREAMLEEEQPIIASVFFNRLAAGMTLGSDPTIQYALGFQPDQNSWWKNPLTYEDTRIESPFNTYIYNGLPPDPICNPGISALNAASQPATTNFYYFQARCDGSGYHEFAETYEEHQANICQ